MSVLIFSTTLVLNMFHSNNKWARIVHKHAYGFHVKYPLFLSDFNETWFLSTDF
jgi:hypothetical protein